MQYGQQAPKRGPCSFSLQVSTDHHGTTGTKMANLHESTEPSRAQIDSLQGATLIEFGAPWCGHCLAAQPLLESALSAYPQLRHLRIEDGPGKQLGRSFRVKLWPTLVFLAHGQEVTRLVRPTTADEIVQALRRLAGSC